MYRRSAMLLLCVLGASRGWAAPDVQIDGNGVYPESITSLANGTLYVGSITGTIYRAAPGAMRAEPWIRRSRANHLLSIFGVLADARSHSLWVCSSPVKLPGGVAAGQASVMRFDLRTGVETGEWPLPSPGALCDDITLAPDGTAFVADLANGEILTLGPHAASLGVFARDPALKGMDGIAFSGDGTLYADNITTNRLLRVDRSATGRFTGLTPLVTSRKLAGPDGLRLIGGRRFALAEGRAGRIDEITITGVRARIQVLRRGLMSPASVTHVGDVVYAADGKIQYLFDPALKGKDPNPFIVHAISMRRSSASP
jgi:Strictosidine synthase-like, N-terminal